MVIACFDIGGTGVKAGLISSDHQILRKDTVATPKTLEELLDWMAVFIKSVPSIEAISLSVPGAIDYQNGVINGLSAIPYIHNISWYKLLAEYQVPIFLENDANCVGLSELASSDDLSTFACIVCGTGIGGALIIDKKLVRGKKSYGGEFGYMIINGLSTPLKNWSQLASTGNMVKYVREKTQDTSWTGEKVFLASEAGNEVCQIAIQKMVENLAIGLMNLYYIFDPEVIYIGGGISQNTSFISAVRDKLKDLTIEFKEDFPEYPLIKPCYYKQDANLMGAFINAKQGGC